MVKQWATKLDIDLNKYSDQDFLTLSKSGQDKLPWIKEFLLNSEMADDNFFSIYADNFSLYEMFCSLT